MSLLREYAPNSFGRYFEPFLGGGSLFFSLDPASATLGDRIGPLVSTYRAVRDGPRSVFRHISMWPVDRDSYYRVRALECSSRFQSAARFIYLNKVGWNGLYRVNSEGTYNVPFGRPKSSNVATLDTLLAASKALKRDVSLANADFEETLFGIKRRDFAFLDPPYVTGHQNNGFVDYNEKLFSWADQQRLASVAEALARKGVHVIVTNADHERIRDLYSAFTIHTFTRQSTLASSASHRRPVTELIITWGAS